MIKVKIIGLLLCVMTFRMYSQKATATHGEKFKDEIQLGFYKNRTNAATKLIGTSNGSIYMYEITDGYNGFIYAFNLRKYAISSLSEQFKKEIRIPEINKKEYRFKNFLILKNELLLCTSSYDEEKKSSDAFISRITSEGTLMENNVVMQQHKDAKGFGNYSFSLSADSSKIVVWYTVTNAEESTTTASCSLLDENLKLLWTKKFEFPYESENCKLSDELVDSEWNLIFRLRKDPDKKDEAGLTQLVQYTSTNDKTEIIPVTIPDKYMLDCSLQFNKDKNLIYAGLYSNSEPKSKMFLAGTYVPMPVIDGAFYFLIGKQNEVISQRYISIAEQYEEQYRAFFYLRKTVLLDDGSVILFAEYYKKITTAAMMNSGVRFETKNGQTAITTSSNSRARDEIKYAYGAILEIGFDGMNRGAASVNMINKNQLTDSPEPSSVMIVSNATNAYIIYNDHIKNKDISDPTAKLKKMNAYNNNFIPMLITVSGNGTMNRVPLLTENITIYPTFNVRISDKEFIFLGEKKLDHRWTKIILNDL